MDRKELAYLKQNLGTIRDWDSFQQLLRVWARLWRDPAEQRIPRSIVKSA